MFGETTFKVTARFENGEPKLKVTAFTGYGQRQASVDRDIDDEKLVGQFAKVAEKAIELVADDLKQESVAAAAECLIVATKKKEVI